MSYGPASSIPELEKQADGLQEAIRECQKTISQYKVMQTMAFEDYAEGIAQISPII